MQSEGEEANPAQNGHSQQGGWLMLWCDGANHHITVLTWPQTCHPKLNQQVKQEQDNNDH